MLSSVKTLYKLARNELFKKEYLCMYCDMIDSNKQWMLNHIRNIHDEHGKIIRQFYCKLCRHNMIEIDIIIHIQTKLNQNTNKLFSFQ